MDLVIYLNKHASVTENEMCVSRLRWLKSKFRIENLLKITVPKKHL